MVTRLSSQNERIRAISKYNCYEAVIELGKEHKQIKVNVKIKPVDNHSFIGVPDLVVKANKNSSSYHSMSVCLSEEDAFEAAIDGIYAIWTEESVIIRDEDW